MTGMNDENLECIIEDVLKYLKDDREELDTRAIIKGKEEEVFGDRERLHMVDVKRLFARGKVLRNVSFMLIIIMALFLLKKMGIGKTCLQRIAIYIRYKYTIFVYIIINEG